jgi:hypothetical protein
VPFVGHAPHPLEVARAPEARARTAAEYFMLMVIRVIISIKSVVVERETKVKSD